MPATRPRVFPPRPSIGISSHSIASARLVLVSGILALEQLLGGAGRIELPLDDAVEQLADGLVIRHRVLQAAPHPRRGELEHLVAQVPGSAVVESPLRLDVVAMLRDL